MKKRIIIGLTLVLIILLVVGSTMAWFTNTKEVTNEFKAGTVEIQVIEEFNAEGAQNINPGQSYDKKVKVQSLGSKKSYVRVAIIPKWEPNNLDVNVVKLKINNVDWAKDEDGWYYYKKILNEGEVTKLLLDGVEFDGLAIKDEYQGATFTLTVKAESVQASHYAFRDKWNKPANALSPALDVEIWNP